VRGFKYHKATSVEDANDLGRAGARILAGGTTLVDLMRLGGTRDGRFRAPASGPRRNRPFSPLSRPHPPLMAPTAIASSSSEARPTR